LKVSQKYHKKTTLNEAIQGSNATNGIGYKIFKAGT